MFLKRKLWETATKISFFKKILASLQDARFASVSKGSKSSKAFLVLAVQKHLQMTNMTMLLLLLQISQKIKPWEIPCHWLTPWCL